MPAPLRRVHARRRLAHPATPMDRPTRSRASATSTMRASCCHAQRTTAAGLGSQRVHAVLCRARCEFVVAVVGQARDPARADPARSAGADGRHQRISRTLKAEAIKLGKTMRVHWFQQRVFENFRREYNKDRLHEGLGRRHRRSSMSRQLFQPPNYDTLRDFGRDRHSASSKVPPASVRRPSNLRGIGKALGGLAKPAWAPPAFFEYRTRFSVLVGDPPEFLKPQLRVALPRRARAFPDGQSSRTPRPPRGVRPLSGGGPSA